MFYLLHVWKGKPNDKPDGDGQTLKITQNKLYVFQLSSETIFLNIFKFMWDNLLFSLVERKKMLYRKISCII